MRNRVRAVAIAVCCVTFPVLIINHWYAFPFFAALFVWGVIAKLDAVAHDRSEAAFKRELERWAA